jgi:hypothetical protein
VVICLARLLVRCGCRSHLVLVGDRLGDQVCVGEEVDQCVGDGGIKLVGVDPGRSAALTAVADAGEAGVAAVAAEFAGRGGADVFAAAFRAGDEAGEVVAGVRRGARRAGLAAGGEDALALLERVGVGQRLVGVGTTTSRKPVSPR